MERIELREIYKETYEVSQKAEILISAYTGRIKLIRQVTSWCYDKRLQKFTEVTVSLIDCAGMLDHEIIRKAIEVFDSEVDNLKNLISLSEN